MFTDIPDERLNESLNTSKGRRKRTIDDFEFLINENSRVKTSDLGKGSYGTVKKAKDRATGKICAIKMMSKRSIFEYSNKDNLKREINIQRSISHPHVVKLYTYFEDTENVYLVLEYAENGNLFSYLSKYKKLTEQEAFVFFFQTCLGIDYLHKTNVIHRDLKPENLLLDKEGNIKLCDFGWSADNYSKRHTFCGTVDYMAPEMVKNHPHDHRLDIWCLGILLYEMLHGTAPFKGRNDQEKCSNIMTNAPIIFDPSLSPEVVDLIKKILQPVPINRLSMAGIFKHPWMKNVGKNFNIDVMSYVNDQDEQIKKTKKDEPPKQNILDSLGSGKKAPKELDMENGTTTTSAKIIMIHNTSPLNISRKATSENKKFVFNDSTKASETSSIGSRSNGSGNNETLTKAYESLSSRVEDLPIKKNSYETSYSTKSYSQPEQGGLHKMKSLSDYKPYDPLASLSQSTPGDAYRKLQTDQYSSKNYSNGASDNYGLGRSLTADNRSASVERQMIEKNPSEQNKNHTRRYTNFGFITEDEDYEEFDGPRLSRVSRTNREIPKRKRNEDDDSKMGFFERLLAGIGCIAREPINIGKI